MTRAAKRAMLVLGGVAAVVLAIVLLSGGKDYYYVNAQFKDVGGLRKNSSVKINGVPAGKVVDLNVTRDAQGNDMGIAKLKVDSNAAPVGRNASVAVRPTDLLGERYAEINPGNREDPLPKGGDLGEAKTTVPVELDDVLNTLDPDTRTRLGILVSEFGRGLNKRGQDLSNVLAVLPPSLQQTQKLIDQVNTQNAALKSVITKGDRITATVNGSRNDMGKLVDEASGALTTVAQKRRDLGATLQNAPATLGDLRSTLSNLSAASIQLRPAAVELRRAAAPLNGTLKALPDFANQAAPTLDTAKKVAPALTRLGREATPTVKRLEPTAKLLKGVLDPAKPLLAHMDRRGTDDLLYFLSNVTKGLQGRDGISHFIGAHFYLNSEYIANAINAFNGVHAPASTTQSRDKKLGLPTAALPKLGDALGKGLKIKRPDLKGLTGKVKDTVKKVVGPVVHQLPNSITKAVDNIAGRLLGGGAPPANGRSSGSGGGDAISLFNYLMGN
jgi:virulence factor Mce-like protein